MADPPWRFATYSDKGRGKSAEQHYETMTLDQIKAMPVASVARKDCWLWLWATAPMYDQARETMHAWGFSYVTQGVWLKTTKSGAPAFGTGYVLRNSHEPYLIGKIGKPSICSRSVRSAIVAQRREHSRKPDEAYRDAALLAGDVPKLELFSREPREGWSTWGNETMKFAA